MEIGFQGATGMVTGSKRFPNAEHVRILAGLFAPAAWPAESLPA